jgi:hypothetical protein
MNSIGWPLIDNFILRYDLDLETFGLRVNILITGVLGSFSGNAHHYIYKNISENN